VHGQFNGTSDHLQADTRMRADQRGSVRSPEKDGLALPRGGEGIRYCLPVIPCVVILVHVPYKRAIRCTLDMQSWNKDVTRRLCLIAGLPTKKGGHLLWVDRHWIGRCGEFLGGSVVWAADPGRNTPC
jgi:hypothetical protein